MTGARRRERSRARGSIHGPRGRGLIRTAAALLSALAVLVFVPAAAAPASGARRPTDSGVASPGAPIGLEVAGGSDWRPDNGFEVRWISPGDPSAIAGAYYRVEDSEGNTVVPATFVDRPGPTSIDGIRVPDPGLYKVSVWLRSGAGGTGPAATTVIRFDDRPPPDVAPAAAIGWVSENEFPVRVPVQRADSVGPSGISGYAWVIDRAGPSQPCPGEGCTARLAGSPWRDPVISIPSLHEGRSWLSVAAVSGAGVRSRRVGSIEIHVDRSPPSTTVSGLPASWVNHPVTVHAHAVDGLSGMSPDPTGEEEDPLTVVQIEGQDPVSRPGPGAEATVFTEGVHRVFGWARDLAGNVGARVLADGSPIRIDTTAPRVGFENVRNPADPELIRAHVGDRLSGVATGSISYRAIGDSGGFHRLGTRLRGGWMTARFPSESVPVGGYELRAAATDKAGNEAAGAAAGPDARMILRTPLKQASAITVELKRRFRRHRLAYRRRVKIAARLVGPAGAPIAHAPIELTERFGPGSRRRSRTRRLITDGSGRVSLRLAAGPSRTVVFSYAGTRRLAHSSSRPVRLRFADRVRFEIDPDYVVNGGAVRMRGSVRAKGARVPRHGKLVAIQYFDPSRRRWRPVAVIRTRRNGRFSYRYRFRTIGSAQRIIFRAVSLKEAGWPYLKAGSKRRSVVVYPARR